MDRPCDVTSVCHGAIDTIHCAQGDYRDKRLAVRQEENTGCISREVTAGEFLDRILDSYKAQSTPSVTEKRCPERTPMFGFLLCPSNMSP